MTNPGESLTEEFKWIEIIDGNGTRRVKVEQSLQRDGFDLQGRVAGLALDRPDKDGDREQALVIGNPFRLAGNICGKPETACSKVNPD